MRRQLILVHGDAIAGDGRRLLDRGRHGWSARAGVHVGYRCRRAVAGRGGGVERRRIRVDRRWRGRGLLHDRLGRRRRRRLRRGRRRSRSRRNHLGGRRGTRRKEPERIEVPLLLARDANAEMHIGRRELRRPARPDRSDRISLTDGRVPAHVDRAEVGERHREPVLGLNRHRLATRRYRSREGHDSSARRDHQAPGLPGDVDPAVLPCCVRVRRIEGKRLQHRASRRPCPSAGGGREREGRQQRRCPQHDSSHAFSASLLSILKTSRPS